MWVGEKLFKDIQKGRLVSCLWKNMVKKSKKTEGKPTSQT
jgi:hypothetical protein